MRDNNDLCLSLGKLDGLQSADATDHLPNSVVGIADIMVCSNLMFIQHFFCPSCFMCRQKYDRTTCFWKLDKEAPKGTDLENYQVLDL
jgi:hypothetical protein